jgi:hypothetical protein
MDKCGKCGAQMITSRVVLVGFPNYYVQGTSHTYCSRCDTIPVQVLETKVGVEVLVLDETEVSTNKKSL